MDAQDRYAGPPPNPAQASLHTLVAYAHDEIARRWYHATSGLDQDDFNAEPGNDAWTIGEIYKHQLYLMVMIIENITPGEGKAVPRPDIGEPGAWDIEAMHAYREELNEKFRHIWANTNPDTLMEKRPDMRPEHWADWPVLTRFMRPLIDVATHIGQINYARRQLGKPVSTY